MSARIHTQHSKQLFSRASVYSRDIRCGQHTHTYTHIYIRKQNAVEITAASISPHTGTYITVMYIQKRTYIVYMI